MCNERTRRIILILFCGLFNSLFSGYPAFAEENNSFSSPPPSEQERSPVEGNSEGDLSVISRYPMLQNAVGSAFNYEITIYYNGTSSRTFALDVATPDGWFGRFTGGYPERVISAVTVEPKRQKENIKLIVYPTQDMLETGEYLFTVVASADDLESCVDLTAVVVPPRPRYLLYMSTSTMKREFEARPNQDNHISLRLQNAQNGAISNIILTADKPEDWDVTFSPATIASLDPGITQEIDVVINLPAGTELGDYPLTVIASGDQTKTEREYRIMVVKSRSNGDVVGVGITVGIIAGLAIWYWQPGFIQRFKLAVVRPRRGSPQKFGG